MSLPCGERGLKCTAAVLLRNQPRRSPCGERGLKYAEAVKLPSQGMYRDGRWCISGVIPYLTAIGGRDAVQYSRKRDD